SRATASSSVGSTTPLAWSPSPPSNPNPTQCLWRGGRPPPPPPRPPPPSPPSPGCVPPPGVFTPPPATPLRSALLLPDPAGRTGHWREGDLCQNLAAAGHLVCAFDVRGIGDLTPELGRGNSFYNASHSSEEAYAWASLILGHPLLAQRVEDILAMSSAVRQRAGRERPLVLAARGHMTLPALCATALDSGLAAAYLARGLVSWA